jgi:DNA polymerase III alpha subunit
MARWRRGLDALGADRQPRARPTAAAASGCSWPGLVSVRQQPTTARGTVFLLLEDEHGMLNVIVPGRSSRPNREAVRHATFLAVYGRAERDGPARQRDRDRLQALRPRAGAASGRAPGAQLSLATGDEGRATSVRGAESLLRPPSLPV